MQGGVREVGDAADVVEVEMGRDDVGHVRRIQAQLLEPADRRLRLPEPGAHQVRVPADASGGIGDVRQPEPGVDQHDARVGFTRQHMAHQPPDERRGERAAIEVVYPHGGSR